MSNSLTFSAGQPSATASASPSVTDHDSPLSDNSNQSATDITFALTPVKVNHDTSKSFLLGRIEVLEQENKRLNEKVITLRKQIRRFKKIQTDVNDLKKRVKVLQHVQSKHK